MASEQIVKLDWSNGKAEASLEHIFTRVSANANSAIQWYDRSKKSKKFWAQNIRVNSILLGSVAALLPTISDMISFKGKALPGGWTTICLGIAGALLLLDKFFGYSSAWMRYTVAKLQLEQILQEFQMDWENERASWQGVHPTKEQINQMLARSKAFTSQINTIVREETSIWVQEFQSTIKYLDEAIKAKPAVTEPGALNIIISNEDVAKEGWELTIDNGEPEKFKGFSAGKRNLIPGRHEIVIKAKVQGHEYQAGKVILVPAGGICEEKLTLV